jgi:hypothetical protein
MWERFIIGMKISSLSNKIRSMEADIIKYRIDMELMNNLYYCGGGDVDTYISEWSEGIYIKIEACERLKIRFQRQLDGVVG